MKKIDLLKYFLIFIAAFSLFSYFQISPTFPDPDSFYHAKIAVLIRDQGIVKDFPWLQFTVLKDYYIDHHFLYHVSLVPFVTFFDPLVGIKLATALFGALLILTFYWFLQKFRVKGAFFYSLIALISSPFIFRINLAKASSVSLIILLFGLYFIFNRKIWPLFVLSFAYVWTYGGWPLMLVLTLFYILSDAIVKSVSPEIPKTINPAPETKKLIANWKLEIGSFFKNIFSKQNIKLFFGCLGGLAAGVIINPYFPKNLIFYWHVIVKIAIINYRDKIGVGAEWYPYGFGDLVANSSFVFILLIVSCAIFFFNFLRRFASKEETPETDHKTKTFILALFFLTLFFLIITLRSRRNVEYFIPFAVLMSGFSLNQPFTLAGKYWTNFKNWWQKRKMVATVVCLYFLILIPFTAVRNVWSVKQLFLAGGSTQKYRGVAEWLLQNTPEGAIVFHNDWDDFPALFYYNTHNYYIAGLDPTLMYDFNKDLHKKWVDTTTNRRENIAETIKNDFRSEYVFVDKDHIALENNLKSDGHFVMVYKDDEGKIYKLLVD